MFLITHIFSQKLKHIFMYSIRLNFLFYIFKGSSLELLFDTFVFLYFFALSFLLSVYFAAHLSLLSVTLKNKQLSLHFRLVIAEG